MCGSSVGQVEKQKALNIDKLRLFQLYYLVSLFDLIISINSQYFPTIDISTFLYLVIFQ